MCNFRPTLTAIPSDLFPPQYRSNEFLMTFLNPLHKFTSFIQPRRQLYPKRALSTLAMEPELKDLMNFLDSLTNYEKLGVPKDAGTDSEDGLDLGRMRRLMEHLHNPHFKFKAVHVAGSKGKGSTAAFISNILRAQGYSVGCYTSPHITTIRERMSVGRSSEAVSAEKLNCVFHTVKDKLHKAIQEENGFLTHFEALTGIAYALFAKEKVDVAVIETGLGGARDATNVLCSSGLAASVITTIGEEHLAALGGSLESVAVAKAGIIKQNRPLVLGGPFLPHIERILRDQASSMSSPVLSASDPGTRATIKGISMFNGEPCQVCDIIIEVAKQHVELSDVKLRMLGRHQLQNAATAACVALCLRGQGWDISDVSIRAGLDNTRLPGRSQFLSSKEAEALGIPGATVLLDGAHTKESAKALMDTIRLIFPAARLAFVVAMASDKDHQAFARELLSGGQIEAVFLTEADIAGGKSRTTSATVLRDSWIQACEELGINSLHDEMSDYQKTQSPSGMVVLAAEKSLQSSMKLATQILKTRGSQPYIVVVTGSLHIVSSVLASLP